MTVVQTTRFGNIYGHNTIPKTARCAACGYNIDVSSVGNQTHLAFRRLLEHVEMQHPEIV